MSSDWIACSERMPEHGRLASMRVLVIDQWGVIRVGWTGPDGMGGREWHVIGAPGPDLVATHWQPLPLPPTRAATTGEGT